MDKTELAIKLRNRIAIVLGLFAALLLAGCAVPGPRSGSPDFSIPPRPKITRTMPDRPPLGPGDVLAGLFEGEAGRRICFRHAKWREVLFYLMAFEAYGRNEAIRLEAHIVMLENRMKK